jgi:hypothetical protein
MQMQIPQFGNKIYDFQHSGINNMTQYMLCTDNHGLDSTILVIRQLRLWCH